MTAALAALLVLGCSTEARTKRAAAGEKSPAPAASVWLEYQIAALKVAVLAFSTLLATTFELLHCVDIGGAHVLFRAATVECGAWQAPLYALALALLLPVAAGLAAAAGVGAACTSRLPELPPALSSKLKAPYRYGCLHWEAVMALHRLCVVAVYSLVSSADSAVAAVLQTLICGAALMVHVACRPFSEPSANHAQTALLTCLTVVALLNVPQAMLDTNAIAESPHATALIGQLKDGEAVLLLAPALLVGTALAALAWQRRRELAAAARAGCEALARCPGATASAAAGLCPAPCGGEADEEAPLEEPLLGGAKLVSNSRGLRLTHRTPTADGDTDEDEGSTA